MPIVPLSISHDGARLSERAFVDTMSDLMLIPDWVATRLQLDLTRASTHSVAVVGGTRVTVRFAPVELEITHSYGSVRWTTDVAFGPTQRWLFGHFGGLEFFHFTLDAINEELILVPRENLPVA